MRTARIAILCLAVAALAACNSRGPQRPSQRLGQSPEPDSAQLALMELNQKMAQTADRQLMILAQDVEESWALYEAGTWVKILEPGSADSDPLRIGDECVLHMRVLDLQGEHLYTDEQRTYILGKMELPMGVDLNLRNFSHGAHLQMLVPWYAAYGMSGNEWVPPYENVLIEIYLR